jgi:S-adenosylmethionine decarboxylase
METLGDVKMALPRTVEQEHAGVGQMCSASMDAWFADVAVLTDEQRLLTSLRDAAAAGGATVVGQASAVFDNGAVTAVLLLAESHLSVHTWPEYGYASFDVLTCGKLSAERIFAYLESSLEPVRIKVRQSVRDFA